MKARILETSPIIAICPPHARCRPLAAFRSTLEAVKGIPAKLWITSHHKGVIADRETFLVLLKAFAARLDARGPRDCGRRVLADGLAPVRRRLCLTAVKTFRAAASR